MTAQADIRTKRRVAALSAGLAVVLLMGVSGGMALAKSAKKAAAKVAAPVDHTQFAYKLDVFTGKGYAENFVPQAEKSMRVVANVGNVIMPKTADVQWSESDGQWVADWENYDHPSQDVGDIMQVLQGGKVITTVRKVTVAIYYPDTAAQDQSTLLTGKQAQDAFDRFTADQNKYWDASSSYQDKQTAYDALVAKLKKTPGATIPPAPVKPEMPTYSISQPTKSFIVSLKPGKYKLRTLDTNGVVIKDSTKDVDAFVSRRTGTGYEIKPENKWTYPEMNDDRTNIIYYVGTSELFFIPNKETEYNVLDYAKLNTPNSPYSNNAPTDQWTWVHTAKRNGTTLKVYKNGKPYQTISEKPWIVVQTPGAALGYNIVEWVKGKSKESAPHFRAHQVILKDKGAFSIRLIRADGKEDPSGYREARPIKEINPLVLFLVSLVPFLGGCLIAGIRAWHTRSQFKGTSA